MKKTGQLLKDAREAKGISLQEVSIHLKISTRTLKALEDGDKAQLPAKTFLRGFVQSYAQFLKISLPEIMVVFQEEMGTTHPGMITTQIAQPPVNYVPPQSNAGANIGANAGATAGSNTTTNAINNSPEVTQSSLANLTSEVGVQSSNPLSDSPISINEAILGGDKQTDKQNQFPTTTTEVSQKKSHSKNKKHKKHGGELNSNQSVRAPDSTISSATTTSHGSTSVNTNTTTNNNNNSAHSTATTQNTTAKQTVNSSVKTTEPVAPALSVDHKTWSHSLKIGTVLLVVIIVSIIVTLKKTIDKYEREATLPSGQINLETVDKKIPTQTNSPTVAIISENSAAATPIATPISGNVPTTEIPNAAITLTTKPPAANLSQDPNLASQSGVQPPANSNGAVPLNSNSTTTVTVSATAAATTQANTGTLNNPIATPAPKVVEDVKTQEVIIEALDRVTIEYAIDGGSKESLILQAEKIHTFKAKKIISLNISDGGSINLIYNGKDKGVPGNLGQAYSVSFPQ